MRLKSLSVLLPILLFICVEPAMADKSYRVSMSNPGRIGSVRLQPGEYTLVLDNSTVRFTEVRTGKEFEVLANIDETAEKKFARTAIHSTLADGENLITEICLGGTKTRLAFP